MDGLDLAVGAFGLSGTAAIFALTYRDAIRREISRPVFWAAVTAIPFLLGVGLYLFAPVPMTGVIMTANTGIVIYTFEREIADEDDEDGGEPVEPGTLPHRK
ncbi:hypothetical protein [Natronococcus jeotgali]|uniref:Uncharacterized protein n=1 Tax=Natronococcus jeotgali DSM 18795 TaxID=1227498 RepID=L9X801_9EURY|nr:hypothetical protein [Natronococcus jeotgali]ELY57884.1 hypothetical protein C492_13219 [Natronococcus jeotgali DSM 18795]